MASESISDILQGLARQRGRGDANPLILWRALDGAAGARVGHVPISQQLSQAWVRLTGDPFRPHQAAALATLRRGEPVALRGSGPAGEVTARLLLFEMLQNERDSSALVLLPDPAALQVQRDLLAPMNAALGVPLPVALADGSEHPVSAARARILLATPAVLHERLLHHYERAWQPFWRRLRVIWVDEAQTYAGVAGSHLNALLQRCIRLRAPGTLQPHLLATLADVAGSETALAAIGGQPWRVVPVDDVATMATAFAVWRGGTECQREGITLAQALRRAGYSVHLSCSPLDMLSLRQLVGDETPDLSIGAPLREAQGKQVQIVVGYPGSHAALRCVIDSGAQATILVLGNQLGEATLARMPQSLLADPTPVWTLSPHNAYVATQHIPCAASESPLIEAEVVAWQAEEVVNRLEKNGQLVQLPGDPSAWQPRWVATDSPQESDPYAGFSLDSAGSVSVQLYNERRQIVGTLDAPSFNRWGFVGATLPPGGSRFRVTSRDEADGTLVVRPETSTRRTYPLRRCQVSVRDEREQRTLRGNRTVGWGRVLMEEEVYGYREAQANSTPAERTLTPPLTSRWSAHAAWVDVGITPAVSGQLVGWSLATALPLRVLASFTDIVPAYDEDQRRLYLVDAHPGGSGLAVWIFQHLEELLPLAYDIALDCRSDSLLEPLARADMDLLLLLLGGDGHGPGGASAEPPLRVEVPALPAPTPPPAEVAAHPPAPSIDDLLPPLPPSVPPSAPVASSSARDEQARPAARPAAPGSPRSSDAKKTIGRRSSAEGRRGRQAPSARTPEARPTRSSSAPQMPPADKERGSGNAQVEPQASQLPLPPVPSVSDNRGGRATSQAQPRASERTRASELRPASSQLSESSTLPDASAMIARMRQLRQQRTQQTGAAPTPHTTRAPLDGEARFKAGDSVVCMPYGNGVVQASWIENDQEMLEVAFPDYGELTIDPVVNVVRMVEQPSEEED